jgi:hypothetical protein
MLKDDTTAPLSRLFSLRHEFPNAWQTLTRAPTASESDPVNRSTDLPIFQGRFPFYLASAKLQPISVFVMAIPKANTQLTALVNTTVSLSTDGSNFVALQLQASKSAWGNALFAVSDTGALLAEAGIDPKITWNLGFTLPKAVLQVLSGDLQDLVLVVNYTANF